MATHACARVFAEKADIGPESAADILRNYLSQDGWQRRVGGRDMNGSQLQLGVICWQVRQARVNGIRHLNASLLYNPALMTRMTLRPRTHGQQLYMEAIGCHLAHDVALIVFGYAPQDAKCSTPTECYQGDNVVVSVRHMWQCAIARTCLCCGVTLRPECCELHVRACPWFTHDPCLFFLICRMTGKHVGECPSRELSFIQAESIRPP